MASISQKATGRRLIQFVGADRQRGTISLGKVSKRRAEAIKARVEELVAAKLMGDTPDRDTLLWVKSLDDGLHAKLAKAGLIASRTDSSKVLIRFVDNYMDSRTDVKPATQIVWGHTRRNLAEHFGENKLLSEVTEADAEHWLRSLVAQNLSEATIRKRCGFAKQFFQQAVKARLIEANPFAELKSAAHSNPKRKFYITREMTDRLIEACPDTQWRTIIALCRYAGLRCPSEVLLLRWSDIDWHSERMTITSPKTEHHEGKGSRVVPLFAELQPHLSEAFDLAADGTDFVVTRYRDQSQNLRTTFLKIIRRAGLQPWPKLFVNLRASAATDLIERFAAHVANAWMGHCESIAREHYRQVTDAHFSEASSGKALQNALQQAHETPRNRTQADRPAHEKTPVLQGFATNCDSSQDRRMEDRGLEPLTFWLPARRSPN